MLQLLFDLRFLGNVLSGGQQPYPNPTVFAEEEPFFSSILSSSNLARLKESLFQSDGTEQQRKRWLVSLQERLSDLLDPIDWETYVCFVSCWFLLFLSVSVCCCCNIVYLGAGINLHCGRTSSSHIKDVLSFLVSWFN